ncbi:MAG: NAD-dependent epimerase/dehydratase family protein [Burkholderiaceae bacterium]
MKRRCLVTGANGFLGRPLCLSLQEKGCEVIAVVRRADSQLTAAGIRQVVVADLYNFNDPSLSGSLNGAQTVYHLAARTHSPGADWRAYQRDNEAVTTQVTQLAIAAKVEHLVFVSSVKAMGERSGSSPLTPDSIAQPEDYYGHSKLAAEQSVIRQCQNTNTQFSILRPPLIYGKHAPGNLHRLISLIRRGVPLPLASVRNKRSMVGQQNLIDLLGALSERPANRILLPADGDWSTPELIRLLAQALNRPTRLWPVPPGLLRLAGRLVNKQDITDRLTRSLQIDDPWLRDQFGWHPPLPANAGLSEMAQAD